MPGTDGTGPRGQGPMTGRGLGYCVLKLPEGGGPPEGFIGVAGKPFGTEAPAASVLGAVRSKVDTLARQLEDVQVRIRNLQEKER